MCIPCNKSIVCFIHKHYETSVYREKKHPYECFTNLSEDESIPMTTLWCPAFSIHG